MSLLYKSTLEVFSNDPLAKSSNWSFELTFTILAEAKESIKKNG